MLQAKGEHMSISDTVRHHYDDYYRENDLHEWRRLGAIDKVNNIADLCQSATTVLDIGCGNGAIISRMADVGFGSAYTGLDISSSAIEAARGRRLERATFNVFDGDHIPFDDGSFDLVVMSHVVEHLEHPRRLIQEAARVGRRVFIEVPCEHTMRLPRDYAPDNVGHINFYTPTTIRRLVQTCGLTVEKQLTRGVSLDVMRYGQPIKGYVQQAVRQAALHLLGPAATAIFVYHSAMLCRR